MGLSLVPHLVHVMYIVLSFKCLIGLDIILVYVLCSQNKQLIYLFGLSTTLAFSLTSDLKKKGSYGYSSKQFKQTSTAGSLFYSSSFFCTVKMYLERFVQYVILQAIIQHWTYKQYLFQKSCNNETSFNIQMDLANVIQLTQLMTSEWYHCIKYPSIFIVFLPC